MKRFLTYLLLILLTAGHATAAGPIVKPKKLTKTITWEITEDGTLRFTGTGTIPIDNAPWRKNKDKIKKIEIGEGITEVEWALSNLEDAISRELLLPSTLTKIGYYAFRNTYIKQLELPDHLQYIRPIAFAYCGIENDTLVIPASVKVIGNEAFLGNHIKHVILLGDTKYDKSSFPAEATITSPAIIAEQKRQEAEKNVNGYIANRLESWEDYRAQNFPSDADIRRDIEAEVEKWQAKGEFETTAEWQKRVNDKTRAAKLEAEKAKYKNKYDKVVAEYNKLRRKYSDEFYKRLEEEYKKDRPFINGPYDADNQTFLMSTKSHGDFLLKVPRNNAKYFKDGYEGGYAFIPSYKFVPKDESSVALQQIIFEFSGYKYIYDGKTDASYAIADIDYNFAPLEIGDIDMAYEAPSQNAVKTVGVKGLEQKSVDVKRRQLSAGSGTSAPTVQAKPQGKSDVDARVPAGKTKRPNTFALVVANENYRRVSAVPYALNDGDTFARYLHTTLGLPQENILHVDDASLNDMNYNLQRLRDICEAFGGEASVIVYYAGHGVPDALTRNAFLLPVDGYAEAADKSGLSLAELTRQLEALPTRQTTLFLDACFSGADRHDDMLSAARGVKIKPRDNAIDGNLVVFSASQGEETAHPYEEQGHGLFTYYLLKKLGETAGEVTLGELADYITDNVRRRSAISGKKQTPTVTTAPGNTAWTTRKL